VPGRLAVRVPALALTNSVAGSFIPATLLLSCLSEADRLGADWRPAVSEQTLRAVLGGAG